MVKGQIQPQDMPNIERGTSDLRIRLLFRKLFHEGEWWFSIIDVVEVLTDSSIPKRYCSDLKRKLVNEGYSELYEIIVQLKFAAADGKFYASDCFNTAGMTPYWGS